MADPFSTPIYKWLADPRGGPPVTFAPDWQSGETANHIEAMLAGAAGQHRTPVCAKPEGVPTAGTPARPQRDAWQRLLDP